MKVKTLFLAWRDPRSRRWFPIGRLRSDGSMYEFQYTQGVLDAKQAGFREEMAFSEIGKVYQSEELFPFFANRLLPASRPEYTEYLRRLGLPPNATDPILLLSRSEGRRVTDAFEVFPLPQREDGGNFELPFFVHGIRHVPPASRERLVQLEPGEELWIFRDCQNEVDPLALGLRTQDVHTVGYCPRYLAPDLHKFLDCEVHRTQVRVVQVNEPPTPVEQRLLCSVNAPWPPDIVPFGGPEYQPVTSSSVLIN